MAQQLYPTITVSRIKNPSRLYAFPLLGFVLKGIMLLPQGIELIALSILAFFMVFIINPFVILFTGKYWDPAYQLYAGILRLSIKMTFFFGGLTNKYPGFGFTIHDTFSVTIEKPSHPNRWLNFPLLGLLVRIILLIPFMFYEGVIRNAAGLAIFGASFPSFFKGYYPESSFELARDGTRLNLSQSMYIAGLSDKYPSFWISMNHQTIKIILIILGALMMLGNIGNSANTSRETSRYNNDYNNTYQNEMMRDYDYEPAE